MPYAAMDGADVYYEVVGGEGPWMAVISGGRHPLSEVEDLATELAARGFRVLVHDRRNCGRSSLCFDSSRSEEDIWAEDLHGLLDILGIERVFLVGRSRSARMAIRFALLHRGRTRALGLWGISGGAAAARFLDDYYYGQYIRACEEGGMAAVCRLGHFAAIVAGQPARHSALLEMSPDDFLSAMRGWRTHFLADIDQSVMGFSDEVLRRVDVPTAIMPYYDRMHPFEVARHAHEVIPESRLFDFDPTRHGQRTMTPSDVAHDTKIVAGILCSLHADEDPAGAEPTK